MTEYEKGYEAGCKHGYCKGYGDGLEARKKYSEPIKLNITQATMGALEKMDRAVHTAVNDPSRSCVVCVDGGIDLPPLCRMHPGEWVCILQKEGGRRWLTGITHGR